MEQVDVAVIGGGQCGPTTACALLGQGLRPVVREASDRAAGSWPRYYYDVVAYPGAYADRLYADIRTGRRVIAVRRGDGGFEVTLEDGAPMAARAVVAASGTFGRP
ncbi:hypothetical protein ABZ250_35085 [Streptomyces afghaniensis]|uniref:hypothetical protein n=1 Tax=Streptomyces afghaniensis TaxID=66865 RepID=UPI0033BFAA42